MSGREWQPGDVAICRNLQSPRVIYRVEREDGVEVWADKHGLLTPDEEWATPPKVYRAVVVDPEDAEQVERLLSFLDESDHPLNHGGRCGSRTCQQDTLASALREFANPTPPKPDEPMGHYAVVTDERGVEWCRTAWDTDYPWQAHYEDGTAESTTYTNIDVATVLSGGVTP